MDYESIETVRCRSVSRFAIRSEADARHDDLAFEAASNAIVDSFRFAPVRLEGVRVVSRESFRSFRSLYLEFLVAIRLVTRELVRSLLHDGDFVYRMDCHLEFGWTRCNEISITLSIEVLSGELCPRRVRYRRQNGRRGFRSFAISFEARTRRRYIRNADYDCIDRFLRKGARCHGNRTTFERRE